VRGFIGIQCGLDQKPLTAFKLQGSAFELPRASKVAMDYMVINSGALKKI
jgi:hypothetical protein